MHMSGVRSNYQRQRFTRDCYCIMSEGYNGQKSLINIFIIIKITVVLWMCKSHTLPCVFIHGPYIIGIVEINVDCFKHNTP